MSELLKVGFFIKIGETFYKITTQEPFQYDTGKETTAHFSAVGTGSESGWINITTLEPDDSPKRLFQVWFGVEDGMEYYWKIPTGNNRFGVDVDKDIGFVDNMLSPLNCPNQLFEFWLINDYYPSINVKNNTDTSLIPRICFTGMKYDIEKVEAAAVMGKPFKEIILGGLKVG